MAGLNKVMIIGRLGGDPELKTLGSGAIVANFSVATSKKYKDKNGNAKEDTEWHRVVVWNKLAQLCGEYLAKGRQVYIEGELRTRSWEKDGEKRYATEINALGIQFLGQGNGQDRGPARTESDEAGSEPPGFDSSEEIPF